MGAGLRAKDDPRGVPFVVMAAEPYARIARLLGRGLEVELELDLRVRFYEDDLMAYNTLADLPGSGPKRQEVVMIGAHLDSWHGATGATDNGAGSAVAMEAMRILSSLGTRPRRAVRIGLWSGEEQGLLGSRAYVAQHLASGARGYGDEADPGPLRPLPDHALFSAYFNLDGGTGRLRGVHLQENLAAQPILEAWAGPLADLGLRTVTQRRDFSTDHVAFDDAGLPAFNFIQDRIEYDTLTHHTTLDVYDRAQREDLMQAAVVLASFAWQAANREELMPRKPLSQAGRRDRR
jgi:Zn-dependent M28 family amino/carboxypeptidase